MPLEPSEELPIPSSEFRAPGPKLRTSSYTIYVDLPGDTGEMLLVHGYTGAFDKVSRRIASYLRSVEARRPPKLLHGDWTSDPEVSEGSWSPSGETLEMLERRGYLTERTLQEEEDFTASLATRLHEARRRSAPTYMFMPTYNCNLRCPYCFQDHMRTDPKYGHLLRTMSPQMVDRIFSAIPGIEAAHGFEDGIRLRDITFFGGEPLLAASRPVVERIIEAAQRLGPAKFSAVTNGTELPAYKGLLSPRKIASLQITIDGPAPEHDRRRFRADGSGTYETILGNIRFALDEGVLVGVRINLDRTNLEFVPSMVEDFTARGLDQYPNFKVYASAIRPENPATDARTTFSTSELDLALAALRKEHPQTSLVVRDDSRFINEARQILSRKARSFSFRESFCSSHSNLYIFDAFGDVYLCWDRTGDPDIRLGHLEEDGGLAIDRPIEEVWRTRNVSRIPSCRRCRYALLCGGGCAVSAYNRTGSYLSNFCDDFSSRFRSQVAKAFLERTELEQKPQGFETPCG